MYKSSILNINHFSYLCDCFETYVEECEEYMGFVIFDAIDCVEKFYQTLN